MKSKRHHFVGTIYLYEKGKKNSYGATTRQVNAFNKSDARRQLKLKFKFKDNRVVVKNIHQVK